MRKKLLVMTTILIFGLGGMAGADTVQLDLLSLGCPTEFNFDLSGWQQDFDLGITFTEISHVYIDWSGGITAGLTQINNQQPFPENVGILADLGSNPWARLTSIYGGQATYPATEFFNGQNEFIKGEWDEESTWSDLFDGKGTILLEYNEYIIQDGGYVQHGSIILDSATLVVEGTIVPEPATIFLLGLGVILAHKKSVC